MIDFRSIRVGNILAYCTHPVTIQTIGKNTFGFTDNKNEFQREINNTNFTGIPLSPAILEKSGFVDDGNVKQSVYVYKDKNLSFSIAESQLEDNEMYISCDNAFSGINTVTGVKYLHQIQNIVSALTGQELQITL